MVRQRRYRFDKEAGHAEASKIVANYWNIRMATDKNFRDLRKLLEKGIDTSYMDERDAYNVEYSAKLLREYLPQAIEASNYVHNEMVDMQHMLKRYD